MKKAWIIGAAVILAVIAAYFAVMMTHSAWLGRSRDAGEIAGAALPAELVGARSLRQDKDAPGKTKRILFGDLHVHTTYSTDAFTWSLPIFGGEGIYPLADACDFARYCSQLDFFAATDHAEAMTPKRWTQTKASIRQCNARAADAANPDLVAFVGFEWTQVGRTPADHYGHKNVIFEGLDDSEVSKRAIAAAGLSSQALRGAPTTLSHWLPVLDWKHRQDYFDYNRYIGDIASVPDCGANESSAQLPSGCFEAAATPADLVRRLDDQKLRYLLIPHGTTWGFYTPPGTTLDKQLAPDMRPEKQTLIEVMSGHGNSEEFRAWREIIPTGEMSAVCPVPTKDYEPACWRAGTIMKERCLKEGKPEDTCKAMADEVRQRAATLSVAYHLLVPGVEPEDWLDSGQCRDCFVPSFQYRPRTSVQYGLAITNFNTANDPLNFRWGFIGSSDNHRARPGTGYKAYDRPHQTESSGANTDEWRGRINGPQSPPSAQPAALTQSELLATKGSFKLVEAERQASFFTTGALAAVHSEGRSREQIFEALERREVYATSGPRILLWFDLVNSGAEPVPMGGQAALAAAPEFEVRALGDFKQKPGCPPFPAQGMPAAHLENLCKGECYNPDDARLRITRIEIVKIRPQTRADEPVEDLIQDPWMTLPCDDKGQGCTARFGDKDFALSARKAVYYARAIQEPTPRINGANLRSTKDAEGRTTAVNPCWGDYRTPRNDACVANVEERAWASPITVVPAALQR